MNLIAECESASTKAVVDELNCLDASETACSPCACAADAYFELSITEVIGVEGKTDVSSGSPEYHGATESACLGVAVAICGLCVSSEKAAGLEAIGCRPGDRGEI